MLQLEPSMKCGTQERMWSILAGRHPVPSCYVQVNVDIIPLSRGRGCEFPGTDDLPWCGRPGSLTG
jgi:hypothetical protein